MSITLAPQDTPSSIEAQSFAIIDKEIGEIKPFSSTVWPIARRLVHTTADFDLLKYMHLPEAAVEAGVQALLQGAPIFTDTEMAKAGMPLRRLTPLGVQVECLLTQPGVAERATKRNTTRSRAAIELAKSRLAGAILAIGNAPTSLLELMRLLDNEPATKLPRLVIAMPVGFVNAAESKELLLQWNRIPCLCIRGRKGGSPLAAATLNALAEMALQRI